MPASWRSLTRANWAGCAACLGGRLLQPGAVLRDELRLSRGPCRGAPASAGNSPLYGKGQLLSPLRLRLLGLGDNVVDDYLHERVMYPGGNALNFAVYARQLGHDAAYLGLFGNDAAGRHVQSVVARLGIDLSHCRELAGPNGHAELTVVQGDRVFLGSNKGGVREKFLAGFHIRRYSLSRRFRSHTHQPLQLCRCDITPASRAGHAAVL